MILECIKCRARYPADTVIYTCNRCGSLLDVVYDYNTLKNEIDWEDIRGREFNLWRYREFMPIKDYSKIISLKEGGTPLYFCEKLSSELNIELYLKHEGTNPTGSFKDRGMTVGVSKALELGVNTVACASTGNTSASLAAYAAKAGLKCLVLLPAGKVALGKLAQAIMYGATVIGVKGNFDDALHLIRQACESTGMYLLNSVNPFRLEGQKSIALEIADEFNFDLPDYVILPVGNAGNISAIYKGFKELYMLGLTDGVPRMIGVQAEGASPIVDALKSNSGTVIPSKNPETIATAIRIGNPVNALKAITAITESKGVAESVSDDEIISAQKEIASKEGILCEPASAASIAGLKKLREMGVIERDKKVVAILTGHGLKDPETIMKSCDAPVEVELDIRKLIETIMKMKN
ncbi:MAG: threonine synthase [Candidatus Hydrothermarchaeota archaeon]